MVYRAMISLVVLLTGSSSGLAQTTAPQVPQTLEVALAPSYTQVQPGQVFYVAVVEGIPDRWVHYSPDPRADRPGLPASTPNQRT